MGIAETSKHVSRLLVVALLILATCSAHKYSRGRSSNSKRGRGSNQGTLQGLNRCYQSRQIPCHATGLVVQCYSPFQRCDGFRNCPFGEDEMNCPTAITVTRTSFSTRTSTTTTTSTKTSSHASSTTTTTTVISSAATTTTSSRGLTAIVPWKTTSSAATMNVMSTYRYATFAQVTNPTTGATYATATIICSIGSVGVATTISAGQFIYTAFVSTPTEVIAVTAEVMCMPSTTSLV